MYYEINVTLNGAHFFATAPRSIITEEKAEFVFRILQEQFPEQEGFKVTCSRFETVGRDMGWT